MIDVWILLKPSNQIIHQPLGRNFHSPPGGVAIGEIITPLVIGFLGDLALPQRVGRCLPFVQHPMQLSRLLAVTKIYPQADVALGFLHIQAVPVFQGEKRVHEADVGINIRNRYGMGRHAENLRHLCSQVSLRIPILGFILRHAHIGGIGREVAQQYVAGIMRRLREHEYNPELMKLYIVGGGECLIQHFGEYDPNRVTINDDIRATAKGYEFLANLKLKKASAA